jgi:hypothetical protein
VTDAFTESVVEDATPAWLEGLGNSVLPGPQIAPGKLHAGPDNFAQVIVQVRLHQALVSQRTSIGREAPEVRNHA